MLNVGNVLLNLVRYGWHGWHIRYGTVGTVVQYGYSTGTVRYRYGVAQVRYLCSTNAELDINSRPSDISSNGCRLEHVVTHAPRQ